MIDSHAHLDHPQLLSEISSVLERAGSVGVRAILSVCCVDHDPGRVESFLALIERFPGVFGALGVHPHDAHLLNPAIEVEIRSAMSHPRILAWGEIGLDYYYDNSPREVQEEAFRRQLRGAASCGKPIIIHSRDAALETCNILTEEIGRGHPGPGVMHCFAYDTETASRCQELGFFLGFGGILTFPRSEESRRVAASVPEDRFLIETDSPYLAPVPHRGRRNEPAFLVRVAEKVAEIQRTTVEEIDRRSTSNFCRLFGLTDKIGELAEAKF